VNTSWEKKRRSHECERCTLKSVRHITLLAELAGACSTLGALVLSRWGRRFRFRLPSSLVQASEAWHGLFPQRMHHGFHFPWVIGKRIIGAELVFQVLVFIHLGIR
jgi:hypothetical protein